MNQVRLYACSNELQRRDAAAALAEFAPRLRWADADAEAEADADAVLDVGCGTGDVTATLLLPLLPAHVRRVVAVDVSPSMVRYAAAAHSDPRLVFLQADIATRGLAASPLAAHAGARGFFKLFSFYCLHWVEQRTALHNMFRLLRPGGEALLVFLGKCPIFTVYEALAATPRWRQYMKDVENYISPYQHSRDPAQEFSKLLSEQGFEILECRCQEQSFEYRNVEYLRDAVMAVNPFMDRIPENQKPQFILDSMQAIYERKLVEIIHEGLQKKIAFGYSLMIAHVEKQINNYKN